MALALMLILMLGACSSPVPQDSLIEKNWGRAYETQLYLQTANPEAGKQVAPVRVMEGASSDQVMDAYHKSFGEDDSGETVNIIKLR
jgi:hypothetical protein